MMAYSILAVEFPLPVLIEDRNLQAICSSLLRRLFCVNKAKLGGKSGTPMILGDYDNNGLTSSLVILQPSLYIPI